MKIAVCGKGGSGKSTIVSLLAKGLRERGFEVLVVDSDESNPGLHRMLGLKDRPRPLLELVGGKRNVFKAYSQGSKHRSVLTRDEIRISDLPPEYVEEAEGVKLVCIGKILQSLEGCACPMGALSREFLKRLRLSDGEAAVIDMEAGVEHFGRGVEEGVDFVLMVVEPSFDSIELAEKMKELASGMGKKAWAILNKTPSDEIKSKLEGMLRERGIDLIGSISYDQEIFLSSMEGKPLRAGRAMEEMRGIIDALLKEGAAACA